jgi:hypothetical protein
MLQRRGLDSLFAVLLGLLSHSAVRADQIFVANAGNYTTSGPR